MNRKGRNSKGKIRDRHSPPRNPPWASGELKVARDKFQGALVEDVLFQGPRLNVLSAALGTAHDPKLALLAFVCLVLAELPLVDLFVWLDRQTICFTIIGEERDGGRGKA